MKVYDIYVMSAIIKQPDYIILKSTEEPNMINNEDKLELVNIQISHQHISGRADLSQENDTAGEGVGGVALQDSLVSHVGI